LKHAHETTVTSRPAWLDASGIMAGPIFIWLDAAADEEPSRLAAQSVAPIFKRITRSPALPDIDPSQIGSHSARIGATHDLVDDGASDAAIMRDAGWRTPRMVGIYSRGAKAKGGAMAARLERPVKSFAVARRTEASLLDSNPILPHSAKSNWPSIRPQSFAAHRRSRKRRESGCSSDSCNL
jgi:hypothetical protein